MDTEQTNLSIEQVLGVLRRRAPVILLCFVLAAGAAYGFSKHQTKKYTATASLVFNNNQLSQQVAGLQALNNGGSQLPQQQTNLKLVQLGDMATKTASVLGQGLTKEKVSANLSVSAQGESNIVNVSATSTSPVLAASIANTYTSVFVREQQNSNHAYYASALKLVNRQVAALSPKQKLSPSGIALAGRAQSLGVLAELHNGNVEVAQAATVPTSPSSPKTSRNTALGVILGLLLGLGVAFLLERLDRRIREPKDLEAVYGLPLLGVVPERGAVALRQGQEERRGGFAGERGGGLPSDPCASQVLQRRQRAAHVDGRLGCPWRWEDDGRAASGGRGGEDGLAGVVVGGRFAASDDCSAVGCCFGSGGGGCVIGAVSLGEATQAVDLNLPGVDGSSARSFDVLVAGSSLPPNPGELIESHAMESLLEQVKMKYDLIVVDTPPLTAVSDAFPLLGKVDGVIIVGRVGRNRRDVAQRLHETLTGAGAPLLGVVANGFKSGRLGGYGYGYSYDYAAGGKGSTPPKSEAPSVDGAALGERRFGGRGARADESDLRMAHPIHTEPGRGSSGRTAAPSLADRVSSSA